MGKIKDLFNGEHKTFFRFTAFCVSVFIILWIVGPGNTIIHWGKARIELGHQKKQMEQYQKEIEHMRKQVQMLKTDRDTLEKFAREQFLFAVPGEDVYVVSD